MGKIEVWESLDLLFQFTFDCNISLENDKLNFGEKTRIYWEISWEPAKIRLNLR